MTAEGGDDEADEIVGRCRERLERGESLDVEAVVRDHPALGDVLRRRLSVLALLHQRAFPADARTPLRMVDPERYVQFAAAGEGGMGVVYSAVDTEFQRVVAFKVIRPDAGEGQAADASTTPLDLRLPEEADSIASSAFEERKARFLQEAWITGGLEHPGVVPIYEMGETPGGIPYYTMRLVRGLRTLAQAIAEVRARPIDDRLGLIEPFLRLCDTVAYAHSMKVVHRDVKPANVALGNFGEVVLLDWGLAKLEGREDTAANRWQARVRDFREAADLRTVAAAVGTPGYMSPEAATGRLDDVDARSDVYSLGTILFEILTGRLPFAFSTYAEFVSKVSRADAPRARSVDPGVPAALDDLVARCLSRDRDARPKDVASMAQGIRSWLAASALEREVAGHLRDASAALGAAESATGEDRLRHADRAAAAIEQATARDPARPEANALAATLASLRARGMAEHGRASRRRVLVRGGIGVLAAAAVAAVLIARAIDEKRRDAETARADAVVARGAAETARTKTQATLDELLRLSDSKRVRDLLAEAERLWPAQPERAAAMAEWTKRAREVLQNRPVHADVLERLRQRALPDEDPAKRRDHQAAVERLAAIAERLRKIDAEHGRPDSPGRRAGNARPQKEIDSLLAERRTLREEVSRRLALRFESPDDDWRHQVLCDLLVGLDRLQDPSDPTTGMLVEIERRHAFASTLEKVSIEDHEAEWKSTIEGIARSTKYGGLRIVPQVGLVPLGRDARSGLFEFAHMGSGPIAVRDPETGRLPLPDEGFSIVLVLIPGGSFHMGAQATDPALPHFDPEAPSMEGPGHDVTLSPYFLSKYECTQAQWKVLSSGEMPSLYWPEKKFRGRWYTLRHPVEFVSWEECVRFLPRYGLRLPTEAQWECACRAGTHTPWPTGTDSGSLQGFANIGDKFAKDHEGPPSWGYTFEVDDGWIAHAPVGSFAPNAYGLFDTVGNVWEWCKDAIWLLGASPTKDPVAEGPGAPVIRGGAFSASAWDARSARRHADGVSVHDSDIGVRPARNLVTK